MYPLRDKLLSGFYGFWVRNYRIGIMGVFLIFLLGFSGIISIPKESSPDIKFWLVSISTAYIGASPEDIDSLITTRIEKQIKSIQGIDTLASSSRQGFSSIVVTLKAEADIDKLVQQIKDGVSRADLPTDATDPSVNEISTESQRLFSVFLSHSDKNASRDILIKRANDIQKKFEWKYNIDTVVIDGGDTSELEVIVHGAKMAALQISPAKVAEIIRQYNQSFPIGKFTLDTKSYDFRIEGDVESFEALLKIPVNIGDGGPIPLGEFATIKRTWKNTAQERMNQGENIDIPFVQMTFNKQPRKSVFSTAKEVRAILAEQVASFGPEWHIEYGFDLAEVISEDYSNLGWNAVQTLILVFGCVFFFIGIKESLIAAISIPLAFLISILTLNWLDLSLNFMTNFSLVLSFGIAIDLTLVIIEETTKKTHLGFSPSMAVLLAINELKLSVISSTAVTLIVFVPMMVLPGIIGKFLSYIPITVFSTLLATLFLALSTNSSLFVRITKNSKWYIRSPFVELHMSPEELALLAEERIWKEERPSESQTYRERLLERMEEWYEGTLKWWMDTMFRRRLLIWGPVILTILSFIFLAPRLLGGSLFPSDDSPFVFITVSAPPGTERNALLEKTRAEGLMVEDRLTGFPEVKFSTFKFLDNTLSIYVELSPTLERKKLGQRKSQEMEKVFLDKLAPLQTNGLEVAIKSEQSGPPTWSPVSIKLLAAQTDQLSDLKRVVRDFEVYLKELPGTKNVNNTSQDSPWEIVMSIYRDRVAAAGLSPLQIYSEISNVARWVKAGSMTVNDEDIDIIVKSDAHYDALNIDQILSQTLQTPDGPITIGSLVKYEFRNALVEVRRVDWDLTISAESEVRDGYKAWDLLLSLNNFAASYAFPEGISYKKWWEFEANRELLIAVATALITSVLLIFVILVFVFNSYSMPLIILYTIILGLLGVNVGLWWVNLFNSSVGYNMPMGIWFISLMGLVVTNAIILIDKINRNRDAGMSSYDMVIDGGKTRMMPQIVTALTTVFGLLPTAFQDAFWGSLSWTVIWWTIIATILTLYSIPALYYNVYGVTKSWKIQKDSKV